MTDHWKDAFRYAMGGDRFRKQIRAGIQESVTKPKVGWRRTVVITIGHFGWEKKDTVEKVKFIAGCEHATGELGILDEREVVCMRCDSKFDRLGLCDQDGNLL